VRRDAPRASVAVVPAVCRVSFAVGAAVRPVSRVAVSPSGRAMPGEVARPRRLSFAGQSRRRVMQVPGRRAVMGMRARRTAGWVLVPVLGLLGIIRLLPLLRFLPFLRLRELLGLRRLLLQMPEGEARVLRLLLQMPERMSRRRRRLGGRARDGLRSGDRNAGRGGGARGRLGLGFRCRLRAGGARGLLGSGGGRSRRSGGHRCSRATRCRRSRRPRGGVSRRRGRPVRLPAGRGRRHDDLLRWRRSGAGPDRREVRGAGVEEQRHRGRTDEQRDQRRRRSSSG
jgi:hypothetical protein